MRTGVSIERVLAHAFSSNAILSQSKCFTLLCIRFIYALKASVVLSDIGVIVLYQSLWKANTFKDILPEEGDRAEKSFVFNHVTASVTRGV